ncbi:hypothetical protein M3Y98_00684500 [Aphelenchoides besseyi]|nr:hypothetical protein M3Y98_00684500 [Aphelenchoides besseyi]KAI6209054.1 hypothetical protein M3Y96_00180400 [Aphelenchoides besseyi]
MANLSRIKLENLNGEQNSDDEAQETSAPQNQTDTTSSNISCSICGMKFKSCGPKVQHEKAHLRDSGCRCSICGIYLSHFFKRTKHEKDTHNLTRFPEDQSTREAVKIKKSQLSDLFNVGFKLLEVQRSAKSSKAQTKDRDATIKDIRELMEKNPQRASAIPPCPVCGMQTFSYAGHRELHVESHSRANGYICSLCGSTSISAGRRNKHERRVHQFERTANIRCKNAVKIPQEDIRKYKLIGKNFEQVQESALPLETVQPETIRKSPTRKRTLDRLCKSRVSVTSSSRARLQKRPKVEIVTLSDSEGETSFPQTQSFVSTAPLQLTPIVQPESSSSIPSLHSTISIPQAQPMNSFQTPPISIPFAQNQSTISIPSQLSTSVQASQSTIQFPQSNTIQLIISFAPPVCPQPTNDVNLLINELNKKPQFIYYDYKSLQSSYSVLPISTWLNSASCELLVLRLDSNQWIGNIELSPPFCRFTLSDEFGYFLAFAKSQSQVLANRFAESVFCLSFKQLVKHVNEMNFQKALVITNTQNRSSISHLATPLFVIL